MTPDESLSWLYGLQQFGVKLGLNNVRELLLRLDSPQCSFSCVHVAGTNGKGSVSAFLAEILRQSGLRVGLYTSPHLHSFTERIRVNGEPLAATLLPGLAQQVRQAGSGIPATFFEATTAMALLAFQEAGVEIAVLETGMGGRLDATNAVDPVLSLITPVSMDHQEHLGATLAEIATEKAGIIKPAVPVIVGRQATAAEDVITATAARLNAPLWLAGRDYRWGGDHGAMWFEAPQTELGGLSCALPGGHQLDNYAQALAAATYLRQKGWQLGDAALRAAGENTRWPGRLEWCGSPPVILLDGAHNAAGAAVLARYLAEEVRRPVRLVTGLSGQRRPEEVLAPLAGSLRGLYATPVPGGVVSVPVEQLLAWARHAQVPARAFSTEADALLAAMGEREEEEIVVVAGSLYLVAAVRGRLCDGRAPDVNAGR